MSNGTAVRTSAGDFVGYINQDVYTKIVYRSRHLLKAPAEGWAFDAESMDKFIRPAGVKLIRVIDREEGKTYEVSMDKFIVERGELSYSYGRQYFLILQHWIVR